MQDEPSNRSQSPITLNCLNGRQAPPIVLEGWKQLKNFSPQTLDAFWILLGPVLLTPESESNQELISLFCKENDVAPDALLVAVGCCEILLKQAAATDLPQEAFRQDLLALSEDAVELCDFITKRYPEAKTEFRKKIMFETLSSHGKVMTGLNWRLDKVLHSSMGNRLDTDIVLLTLNYTEAGQKGQITLQLPKEAARELKHFCNHLLDLGNS